MKITRRESIKTIVSAVGAPFLLGGEVLAADKFEFSEELSGHITEGIFDFKRGEEIGKNKISFKGAIVIDDLDRFEEDPGHAARFEGNLAYNGHNYPIDRGKVKLFTSGYYRRTRDLVYLLPFSIANRQYVLCGYKQVRLLSLSEAGFVADMTTLYTHLHKGALGGTLESPQLGRMMGAGIMHFDVKNVLGLAASCRPPTASLRFFMILFTDAVKGIFSL